MNTAVNIPFVIKTGGSITLFIKSECMTIALDHPNYNKIVDALKTGDHSKIENLVNIGRAVTSYARGKISINNGEIFYGDFAVHNTLADRILKMMADGFKVDHMLLFLDNLMQNPSSQAVSETYTFLENFGLPITEDGCFLAYKAVRGDFTDIYSGKFFNGVGSVVKMERFAVDDTHGKDCSHGLHVGALDYVVGYGHFKKGEAPSGGNVLLVVKVNPKNVVSVPKYDLFTKMRVCEYTVVSQITDVVKELDKVVYTASATPLSPDENHNDEDQMDDWNNDDGDDNTFVKPTIDTTSPWDESAYIRGWECGMDDVDNDNDYGYNRDYSEENSYRIGYNDAFNGRENQADSGCGADCDCGNKANEDQESADDAEYNEGYDTGKDDAIDLAGYQHSLDIDASDLFKSGYKDGFNDYN